MIVMNIIDYCYYYYQGDYVYGNGGVLFKIKEYLVCNEFWDLSHKVSDFSCYHMSPC